MAIFYAEENNFDQLVLHSEKPVLLDFFATWCGPCKMLGSVLEEMSSSERYDIVKVDIDRSPGLARRWNVTSVPTMYIVKDGKEQEKLLGFQPKFVLEKKLRRAAPN